MHAIQLLPKKNVLLQTGLSHTKLYQEIRRKKFIPPVKVGKRSLWPAHEIEEICRAWIAGRTDAEITALVTALEAARKSQNA